MGSTEQPSLRVVVVAVALSAPLALGFETLLRKLLLRRMLGPVFDEARAFFSPQLTLLAWGLTLACGLFGVAGILLMRRALARVAPGDPEQATRRLRDQLLQFSSVPQIPAIFATLCFMMGAQLLPVLVCMGISSVFVLVQGFMADAGLRALQPDEPSRSPC